MTEKESIMRMRLPAISRVLWYAEVVKTKLSRTKAAVALRHDEFAILLSEGMSQKKAYMKLYPDTTLGSARHSATMLARKPEVAEMVAKLREEAFEAKKLSRAEKLAYLADVVRKSPASAIGKDGKVKKKYRHLIQEATVIRSPDGTVATKIKFPSKNEAVRIDNNMQGHDGAVKVEGKLTLAMLLGTGERQALPDKEEREAWEDF